MSTSDAEDRREYYRIEDRIALEFHPLDAAEAAAGEPLRDPSPLFNLLGELHLAELESQQQLRVIGERDRVLASYLKLQNRRIDLLGQAMAQSLLQHIGPARKVTLSEGGISFPSEQPQAPGTHLALRMVLMPPGVGLLLHASVAHCRERAEGGYEIGAEFVALGEPQRQLLARYILQTQARERREARRTDAEGTP